MRSSSCSRSRLPARSTTRSSTSRACPAGRASPSGTSSRTATGFGSGGWTSKARPIHSAASPRRSGAAIDFDEVVLGIPVGALRPICGELIERDELFARGDRDRGHGPDPGVPALDEEAERRPRLGYSPNSVAGCYVEPMDTYCDMSHLLPRESWGADGAVEAIGYFCGVLGHREGETAEEASERVRSRRRLLPRARPIRSVARGGQRIGTALRVGPGGRRRGARRARAFRIPVLEGEPQRLGALRPHPGGLGRAPAALGPTPASRTWSSPGTGPRTASTAAASRRR